MTHFASPAVSVKVKNQEAVACRGRSRIPRYFCSLALVALAEISHTDPHINPLHHWKLKLTNKKKKDKCDDPKILLDDISIRFFSPPRFHRVPLCSSNFYNHLMPYADHDCGEFMDVKVVFGDALKSNKGKPFSSHQAMDKLCFPKSWFFTWSGFMRYW